MKACPLLAAQLDDNDPIYRLTLKHATLGGHTKINLPVDVHWTNRWGWNDRNPDIVKQIKAGLYAIIAQHHGYTLTGLLVDQFFRTGDWRIEKW